ncbi:MAG: hypothetical protein HFI39_12085 [Lachnospiraceae bacterium]|nr:hypothetical protein [Lachnospiraceae bacterium]
MNNRKKTAALLAACALLACGCGRREPVTMNLEEVRLNRYADAVVQTMNEYQVIRTRRYLYPGVGSWLDVNRTASIYRAEPEKICLFTEREGGGYEWREVHYPYGFYDAVQLQGREAGSVSPLLIAPIAVAADANAIAYQTMDENGYVLAVSETDKRTVFLDESGQVLGDRAMAAEGEHRWNHFEYGWSADGTMLFYYKMAESEQSVSSAHYLSLPYGVYSYDRASGQIMQVWEPLELKLRGDVSRVPAAQTVAADSNEGLTAMIFLFDDASGCPDVLLWGGESEPQVQFLSLPENPCIQMALEEEAYYYQEEGKIQKARLGVTGQPELIVYTDPGLQSFLVSSDGQKVFTVEKRGDTEDICLYICDEKKNWYKQILYVGAEGTRSIQLSEDELKLLIEGRVESTSQMRTQSQALILEFYHEETPD